MTFNDIDHTISTPVAGRHAVGTLYLELTKAPGVHQMACKIIRIQRSLVKGPNQPANGLPTSPNTRFISAVTLVTVNMLLIKILFAKIIYLFM